MILSQKEIAKNIEFRWPKENTFSILRGVSILGVVVSSILLGFILGVNFGKVEALQFCLKVFNG